MFNSLAIYRWPNGSCTRIAGQYFDKDKFLEKKIQFSNLKRLGIFAEIVTVNQLIIQQHINLVI